MDKESRERFKAIEKKIDKHGIDIAAIREQNKSIFFDINEVKKALLGNGRKGLIQDSERHETYFKILGVCIITIPPITAIIVNIIL